MKHIQWIWVFIFYFSLGEVDFTLACGSKRNLAEAPGYQQCLLDAEIPFHATVAQTRVPKGQHLFLPSAPPAEHSEMSFGMQRKVCLSPPWWIVRSELINSIGKTPGVSVGSPQVILPTGRRDAGEWSPQDQAQLQNSLFSIEVRAPSLQRARALAFVLKPLYQADSASISVWVSSSEQPGVPVPAPLPWTGVDLVTFVEDMLSLALEGNPHLVAFTPKIKAPLMPDFFVVFNREEIQFFADNTGDAYRNINAVAEDVFAEVLNLSYFNGLVQVGVSTMEKARN